ncbi:hypothetical protein KIPB_008518 [Kipferlia bialata]|uniref:Uncharacterized protein n=1 Tax=Kipferlia bialata TaxID=797122 RepID=A0A9K3D213_9EUKA|nr:hypothetical protein KIPB_008518 [Kipferlia bialata]|eukprot:g8518.t1
MSRPGSGGMGASHLPGALFLSPEPQSPSVLATAVQRAKTRERERASQSRGREGTTPPPKTRTGKPHRSDMAALKSALGRARAQRRTVRDHAPSQTPPKTPTEEERERERIRQQERERERERDRELARLKHLAESAGMAETGVEGEREGETVDALSTLKAGIGGALSQRDRVGPSGPSDMERGPTRSVDIEQGGGGSGILASFLGREKERGAREQERVGVLHRRTRNVNLPVSRRPAQFSVLAQMREREREAEREAEAEAEGVPPPPAMTEEGEVETPATFPSVERDGEREREDAMGTQPLEALTLPTEGEGERETEEGGLTMSLSHMSIGAYHRETEREVEAPKREREMEEERVPDWEQRDASLSASVSLPASSHVDTSLPQAPASVQLPVRTVEPPVVTESVEPVSHRVVPDMSLANELASSLTSMSASINRLWGSAGPDVSVDTDTDTLPHEHVPSAVHSVTHTQSPLREVQASPTTPKGERERESSADSTDSTGIGGVSELTVSRVSFRERERERQREPVSEPLPSRPQHRLSMSHLQTQTQTEGVYAMRETERERERGMQETQAEIEEEREREREREEAQRERERLEREREEREMLTRLDLEDVKTQLLETKTEANAQTMRGRALEAELARTRDAVSQQTASLGQSAALVQKHRMHAEHQTSALDACREALAAAGERARIAEARCV